MFMYIIILLMILIAFLLYKTAPKKEKEANRDVTQLNQTFGKIFNVF